MYFCKLGTFTPKYSWAISGYRVKFVVDCVENMLRTVHKIVVHATF
jgi:hypothetical protein